MRAYDYGGSYASRSSTFRGLRPSDTITDNWYRDDVRWYWRNNPVGAALGNVSEAKTGTLGLWWEPSEKYVPGQYRVELAVDGQVVQRGNFSVR